MRSQSPVILFLQHVKEDSFTPVVTNVYGKQFGIGVIDFPEIKFPETAPCFNQAGKLYGFYKSHFHELALMIVNSNLYANYMLQKPKLFTKLIGLVF